MNDHLKKLVEQARTSEMSDAERETQRLSFAYGNGRLHSERVTRDTVRKASKRLAEKG